MARAFLLHQHKLQDLSNKYRIWAVDAVSADMVRNTARMTATGVFSDPIQLQSKRALRRALQRTRLMMIQLGKRWTTKIRVHDPQASSVERYHDCDRNGNGYFTCIWAIATRIGWSEWYHNVAAGGLRVMEDPTGC